MITQMGGTAPGVHQTLTRLAIETPPDNGIPGELPDYVKHAVRGCADPLATARDLRSLIQGAGDENERIGGIREDVMRALCDSGIWGLKVPRKFGGAEVDARTYLDVIEELSYADGSTGWTVMAAGFSGGAPMLGPSALKRIYDDDEGIITAAQISSMGKAQRVHGGYQVTEGRFHFGSGSMFASWFGGAFAVEEKGRPVLTEHGKPKVIFCFTSRDKVRIKGNWDVFGLAATGSYDWDFMDQEIPDDWVAGVPGRATATGPIHAVGVSLGHVAWALGVGNRALNEIHTLAVRKRRFGRATLIDHSQFQLEYGDHLTALEAARALSHKAFGDWYEDAKRGPVGVETRASARRAACWSTKTALRAAQFAMLSAGSDGLRNEGGCNALQRVFRDLQTGSTHRHVDQDVLLECSQVALGVNDPLLEL